MVRLPLVPVIRNSHPATVFRKMGPRCLSLATLRAIDVSVTVAPSSAATRNPTAIRSWLHKLVAVKFLPAAEVAGKVEVAGKATTIR